MKIRITTLVAALAISVTGCVSTSPPAPQGTSGEAASDMAPKADPQLHSQVPEKYKTGVKVAVFGDWAPEEYLEGGEVKGWAVELSKEMSERMGVPFTFEPSGFDAIIPSLDNGRFDFAVASLGVTPERLQSLDFVPLQKEGTAFAWKSGNEAARVQQIEDACGKTVAVLTGAWEYQYLLENNPKVCSDKPMDVQQFKDQPSAELAVASGRVELVAAGSGKLKYASKQSGQLEVSELLVNAVYNGLGVKQGAEIGPVLRATLQSIIDDGTYAKIRDKWGVKSKGDLDKAVLITQENPEG